MRESEAGGFAFERLDVYQRAIEFLVVVARIISELPGGNGSLTDQLRRAALSVPVNVAERRGAFEPLRNRSRISDGMRCDSRRLQGSAAGEPGVARGWPFASAPRRPAEQDVRLNSVVVHVHDYVHGYVQNGIWTQ